MGPLRTGFFYGFIGMAVAFFASFLFLFVDPEETSDWLLAAIADFMPLLALAAYIFLGIVAALRARPERLELDVPYRSQVMRDAALAAALVGIMVGMANLLFTALQATLFADEIRGYAQEAAPRIAAYVEEVRRGLSDPPPPTSAGEVERLLQPPTLRDLGRSLGNAALLSLLLGTLGAAVGALRGRSNPGGSGNGRAGEKRPA